MLPLRGKISFTVLSTEYWIDIGKPEDFARANSEFHFILND